MLRANRGSDTAKLTVVTGRSGSTPEVAPSIKIGQNNPRRQAECSGAYLSTARGRDRGRFFLSRGGADAVGSRPNEEATTTNAGKFARSLWVGRQKGICGVARLVRSVHYALRRAPCIRSFSRPTRLTGHTEIGSLTCVAKKKVETQRSTPPLFFIRPGCSGIVPSPGDGESGTRRHAHA